MILSTSIAEQIVLQLSKVMEHHINIMDINGIIISSTDPMRIGTLHGGAKKIIEEQLTELLIASDGEYEGAKNGINLPIEFNHDIIGVIGLTGKSDTVYKYGQIIKKMTEILLLDTYTREQRSIEQKAKDRFLEEWIFGRYDTNHPTEFKQRAQMLGIDIQNPKRVLVFSIKKNDAPINDQMQTDISHRVRQYLRTIDQAFLFRTSTLFICVVNHQSDERMLDIADHISDIVTKQFKAKVYIGIDNNDIKPIKISFKNANDALQTSLKSNDNIQIYDIVNVDIFINNLVAKYKVEFIEKFFKNASPEEIKSYIDVLKVFYEHDGSLKKASEALYIHTNTLQYRLQKIIEVTGYDPRSIKFAYMFVMAIKIYESLGVNE